MEQRVEVFRKLKETAYARLAIPSGVIGLAIQPTFFDWITWTVHRGLVRRVHWQYVFDGQRFSNPMMGLKHGFHITPTMHVAEYPVDVNRLERLIEEARQIDVPLDIQHPVTLDGEPWVLQVPGAFGDRQLKWNGTRVEWKPIIEWAYRLRFLL
jgi:hypothetical protein